MAKLGLTVSDEMIAALDSEAKKRGAPIASVVREALREYFEKRGVKLDTGIAWGGDRRKDDSKRTVDDPTSPTGKRLTDDAAAQLEANIKKQKW